MGQNKNKIIISVKVDQVDLTTLANYSPYDEPKCFEVYMYLLKKYEGVFKINSFISFLKSIS